MSASAILRLGYAAGGSAAKVLSLGYGIGDLVVIGKARGKPVRSKGSRADAATHRRPSQVSSGRRGS